MTRRAQNLIPKTNATIRVTAASPRSLSALALYWMQGPEDTLAAWERRAFRPAGKTCPVTPGDVRYGHLADAGECVDEVVLACPEAGWRILTAHGGHAVRDALERHFAATGFEITEGGASTCWDSLWDAGASASEADGNPLSRLRDCRTETQAAAVLQAWKAARMPWHERLGVGSENASRPYALHAASLAVRESEAVAGLLQPLRIAVAGAPNVGKSTLVNRLAGEERIVVSPIAGTTRDTVSVEIDLGGYDVTLVDTAGLHAPNGDALSEAALGKARESLESSDVVLFLFDRSRPLDAADRMAAAQAAQAAVNGRDRTVWVVFHKADLPRAMDEIEAASLIPHSRRFSLSSVESDPAETLSAAVAAYRRGPWSGHPASLTQAGRLRLTTWMGRLRQGAPLPEDMPS